MATKTKINNFELDPEWIYKEPIDFEHKKYKLLAYLQKCDKRFDELKIYPHFIELSLHLANLHSISKNQTMLTINKVLQEPDDEILFKDLISVKPPKLDEDKQKEIDKTIKYSGQKIYDAFNVAKSIWNIAHDAITIHIKKNKENLEMMKGFIYFKRKPTDELLVWEYMLKKDTEEENSTRTILNIIYSGQNSDKSFSDITDEFSSWTTDENYLQLPIFEVKCSQEFPFYETFVPMIKKTLTSYIFQIFNFKKMKDLE